ncbi:MAG: acetyltransferase [Colwellia sp.]|nr:acetyltransferase [Colwellia sp.]
MAKIIIFGTQDTAELAHFYLEHDSEHEVVAFSVHDSFIKELTFRGLPVIPFESIESTFSVDNYKFFIPMTARNMNRAREDIYNQTKAKGYKLISYISSRATVYPGTEIGDNCFILEDNTIQPFTKIGNNVVLWSGNHIGHHSEIKNHCFFTSQVVLSGNCIVEEYCFLGVNGTIRDFIHLAKGTLVGMGACITKNTVDWGVYVGNPAILKNNKSFKVY